MECECRRRGGEECGEGRECGVILGEEGWREKMEEGGGDTGGVEAVSVGEKGERTEWRLVCEGSVVS